MLSFCCCLPAFSVRTNETGGSFQDRRMQLFSDILLYNDEIMQACSNNSCNHGNNMGLECIYAPIGINIE